MPHKVKYPVIDGKKECGNCREFKDISEYNKTRNHFCSKCKICRSLYALEYRQRPESKKKFSEYAKQYISDPKNRERKNAYLRKYTRGEKPKNTKNVWRRNWSAIQKQKAVDYKGGCCQICGYSKCLAAMDFHHRNPLEKDGYGTGALKAHWTFEKNKKELDKCILVCVRCHREIHAGVTICPSAC